MSIPSDDNDAGMTDDAAVAALMGNLADRQAANQAPEDGADDEDLEDEEIEEEFDEELDEEDLEEDEEEDEDDLDDEEEDAGEPAGAAAVADDAVVSVVVDGVAQEFTVGNLKRLAGQEAALTRKSQEADLVGQRAAATLQGALDIVLEDLAGYANVDWVLEQSRMDPEDFQWHREQFTTLMARRDRLVGGAQNLQQQNEARQAERVQAEAQKAIQALTDPATGIAGWNDDLYADILDFAVEAGLPEDDVATITNPTVIKLINDARLYRQGQKAAAKKVNLTPRRVRKGGSAEPHNVSTDKAQKARMQKLQSGQGTDDDAIAALVGRWNVKGR